MLSQKLFEHGCVSLKIDIHGTNEKPLFSTDQVGTALCLGDLHQKVLTLDTEEVVVCNDVTFLTEIGVLRLSRDGQTPWSSAFGTWAVRIAKDIAREELLIENTRIQNEKRTLQLENQELLSKRQAEEWLYIIRNLADERDDIFKIGTTGDLDARTSTLGTAMPDGVGRAFSMKCVDGKLCEKLVHNLLRKQHYKKEWFKSDLATLISCVKAAVYVGDGLVRNVGRLNDENLDTIKTVFENLGQTRASPSNKRKRGLYESTNVATVSPVKDNDPLQDFMKTCLVAASNKQLHIHVILNEFKEYLMREGITSADNVMSTTAFTKKLEGLGYTVTNDKRKMRACCDKSLRALLHWQLVVE